VPLVRAGIHPAPPWLAAVVLADPRRLRRMPTQGAAISDRQESAAEADCAG